MGTVTKIDRARFSIGELIHHKLFNYRGVIVDVDHKFRATEEWYEQVALSRPPKHKPWYQVLVHNHEHSTYVAEQNLEPDDENTPIIHPAIEQYFNKFENGHYTRNEKNN